MQMQCLFLNMSAESLTWVAHLHAQAPAGCTVSISLQSNMEERNVSSLFRCFPPLHLYLSLSPLEVGN